MEGVKYLVARRKQAAQPQDSQQRRAEGRRPSDPWWSGERRHYDSVR
jgi:hypothetical protein